MVGSTGTGKTLLARTIAKLLHVPFKMCIRDSTLTDNQIGFSVIENSIDIYQYIFAFE